MPGFQVQITGAKELADKIHRASATITNDLVKWMLQAALHVEGTVREVIMRTFTKNPTGNMARSFKARILKDSGDEVAAGVYSELIYAKIQDQGGTITPRTRRNLAIPLNAAASKRWPREWGGKLRLAIMRGKKFLIDDTGKPQYILKEAVTIRGRRYLNTSVKEAMPGVRKFLGDKVHLALR